MATTRLRNCRQTGNAKFISVSQLWAGVCGAKVFKDSDDKHGSRCLLASSHDLQKAYVSVDPTRLWRVLACFGVSREQMISRKENMPLLRCDESLPAER